MGSKHIMIKDTIMKELDNIKDGFGNKKSYSDILNILLNEHHKEPYEKLNSVVFDFKERLKLFIPTDEVDMVFEPIRVILMKLYRKEFDVDKLCNELGNVIENKEVKK